MWSGQAGQRTGSVTQAQATCHRPDESARLLAGRLMTGSVVVHVAGLQAGLPSERTARCRAFRPVKPLGLTVIGPLGPITQTCWLPLGVGTSQRRRRRRIAVPMPPRVFELVGLALDLRRCYAGSGHLSRRVGCVDLREPDAGLGRSVPDEGMLTWPCARQCGRNHGRVRAGGTAPSRRSVGFAGLGRRLICWTVTQVLDVCLTGLVGDLRGWNAGLSEFETRF